MIELQFRKDLYAVSAVLVATTAFESFAQIERESREDVEIVRLTAKDGEDEASLAGEFANYVLGAAVDGVEAPTEEATI